MSGTLELSIRPPTSSVTPPLLVPAAYVDRGSASLSNFQALNTAPRPLPRKDASLMVVVAYRVNESRLYWYMVSTVVSLRSMKYIREASAATGLYTSRACGDKIETRGLG